MSSIVSSGIRASPHRLYLAVGVALAVLYLGVPPLRGSAELFDVLSASSAIAIVVGIRVHRPATVWPWLLFAAGQALFFVGDVYTYLYPKLSGHEVPFPSFGDALYIGMYPVLMLGVFLVVRRRSPHGDRAGVIDAVIVALGIGLLSWVFLMEPYVTDATLSPLAKCVSVAYPLGDVLLLASALRLVLDGGRRQGAFYLFVLAISTLFVTDAAYGYALVVGTYHHQLVYDAGWLGYYLLWGAVALHPSMKGLVEPSPDRERRLSRPRLVLLTSASVLAPSIEIVRQSNGGQLELVVILSASIVLFLLVIVRVAGLVRQFERSTARERVLREAAARLVAATGARDAHAAALSAATALVGDAGSVRVELEPAAVASARPPADQTFAISSGSLPRGGIEVETTVRLSPLIVRSLQTLADSVSLSLGRSDAVVQMHRVESDARFTSLVRNASDLMTIVDAEGVIEYQSPSIERILGRLPGDVIGTRFRDLLADGEYERVMPMLGDVVARKEATQAFECTLIHADGHPVRLDVRMTDLMDDEHVRGIVLNGRDVSERTAFQAELTHQAFHDDVTGLPNRAMFTNRVEHALERSAREGTTVGVVFLDLDDFKTVNDSLGHPAGDSVLRVVAERLLRVVRGMDTAARFGGDEFAILLEDVSGAPGAVEMAERVIAAFVDPIAVEGQDVSVRPSLGVAVGGRNLDGSTIGADELVRSADAAMYTCKREGLGGFRVFEPAMHARILERLELRGELGRAIALDQLELFFQPLVALATGQVAGFEALCRWNHPTRGLVPPDQFIPLAEESNLIVELGRWVLFEGCRLAVELQRRSGRPSLRIGVNLSARQLQHQDVVEDVRAALARSGLAPAALVLEITESVMLSDTAVAGARLDELRALGVRLAMDDFGTGYSSLGYLTSLPFSILKMDQSFMRNHDDDHARNLAAAIVSLGRTLDLEVVAEGIERRDQLDELRALGCDLGQGYLFAMPMNRGDTERWLQRMHATGGFDVGASIAEREAA